jgi:hypothetical protein
MARPTLRSLSPSDPLRVAAREDFARDHEALGSPLFGPDRPEGPCWTLTDGPARWARPLACGGLEPLGAGRFAAWLYASDMTPRGWLAVARAFDRAVACADARRVEATVRVGDAREDCARRFAERLGLKLEGTMRGFGPDGADHLLMGGLF